MEYFLAILLAVYPLTTKAAPSPEVAPINLPTEIVEIVDLKKEEIPKPVDLKEKSDLYAEKYGVSKHLMRGVVECESGWNPNIQSLYRYKYDRPDWGVKAGDQELSFGLVQIHLPGHPNITKEQALDPDFALDFLASNLSQGRGGMWTCFRNQTKDV